MTPPFIHALLAHRATEIAARIILTFPFWGSGIGKLLDFTGTLGVMRQFDLEPAALYAAATIFVQLTGSLLIITNRATWLGAGMLGLFTALTIPIVHAFWRLEGERALIAFHTAGEHVGMIGALVLVSILSVKGKPRPADPRRRQATEAFAQAK